MVVDRKWYTWQIRKGSFAAGEGGYGCWAGNFGDGSEVAEAATGAGLAEESARHVELIFCIP